MKIYEAEMDRVGGRKRQLYNHRWRLQWREQPERRQEGNTGLHKIEQLDLRDMCRTLHTIKNSIYMQLHVGHSKIRQLIRPKNEVFIDFKR